VGDAILWFAPWLMKGLSVAGTAAMFLVGGGIWCTALHRWHTVSRSGPGGRAGRRTLLEMLLNGLSGVAAGAVVLAS